jgi:hypothetical protein
VLLTSIYSKEDGVVRWQSAQVHDADFVEVTGSHVGLIFNRKTNRAIASTLAVPELFVAAHIAEGDEPPLPGVPQFRGIRRVAESSYVSPPASRRLSPYPTP